LGEDSAAIDDDDVVGEMVRLFEILRGQQESGPCPDQFADDLPHAGSAAGIQACGRFVEEQHLWPGDRLSGESLVVGGIYRDSQAFGEGGVIVDRSLYDAALPSGHRADARLFVRAEPDADLAALRAELTDLVRPYLIVSVQDGAEFADAQAASINTLINLLYVLLLFSVIVAILGIINTLALSVFERTREIGLLRAIGLRRRQLSSMITLEAVTTAVFGAVLGTALGLGLGVALQRGLVSQGLTELAIPWVLIVTMLVASGCSRPAFRPCGRCA